MSRAFPACVVLWGVGAGVALFACALLALQLLLPAQGAVAQGRNYGYEYSGAKSESVAFTLNGSADDALLLFGSSELSTSAEAVPQVPAEVFGTHSYGVNLAYVGQAYDQSLWHAIAAGAYGASAAAPRKVVIIASTTWFEDDGLDAETFQQRFSYSLYRAFCENDSLSAESRAYVRQRLAELGVSEATLQAAARENALACVNDVVYEFIDDLRIRLDLAEVRAGGMPLVSGATETPDFEALYAQALVSAQEGSTNNSWGYSDTFYAANLAGREDELAGVCAGETFSNAQEFDDFACLLQVCREVGFEPLVVILPVSGYYYDLAGTQAADRQACYARIAQLCADAGVQVANFADREYEKYFLHDIVHFGWTGWVAVEEAIYDFAQE